MNNNNILIIKSLIVCINYALLGFYLCLLEDIAALKDTFVCNPRLL